MSTREPEHLSIGEVLAELSDEFPDITISKIRFLESQGLVEPRAHPVGLPEVLRTRPGAAAMDPLPAEGALPPAEGDQGAPRRAAAGGGGAPPRPDAGHRRTRGRGGARTGGRRHHTDENQHRAAPRRRPQAFAPTLPVDEGEPDDDLLGAPGAEAQYSRAELVAAAGLVDAQLSELESYGLVAPSREVDGVGQYDDDAVEVARIAAGFFRRGIEARHLRMYRTSAEREAVLFGQVLMPYVRQRNPEARGRLQDELVELSTLGRRLRAALLRDAVRETLAE